MELIDRLIVDPEPHVGMIDFRDVEAQRTMYFVHDHKDQVAWIKLNALLRACGYSFITNIKMLDVVVMADLKLIDINETLIRDGRWLHDICPGSVTVMAEIGAEQMSRLRDALHPATDLIAVTVVSSITEEEWQARHAGQTIAEAVLIYATEAKEAGVQGLVLSGRELAIVSREFSDETFTYHVVAVRPDWAVVPGDDQKRIVTPTEAIQAGADRLIIGRPIMLAQPNTKGLPQNPAEAIARIYKEIDEALAQ
jgi:orotidine-5'-phosphate decarboxylase